MAKNSLSTLTVSLSALPPLMSKVLRSQQIQPDGPLISPSWQHALISEIRLLPLTPSRLFVSCRALAAWRMCRFKIFHHGCITSVWKRSTRADRRGASPERKCAWRWGRTPVWWESIFRETVLPAWCYFFWGLNNPAGASCRSRLSVLLRLRLNTIAFQVCPFIAFGYSNHTQ